MPAAYATAANMIERYDVRTLGDLCADDGTRVASGSLSGNAKLEAMLLTATGQIKAAALRGQRYTTNELATLAADTASPGGAYLIDLTCQIAFWLLWRRKPYTDDQQRQAAEAEAKEALEALRNGDHVFDIARQQEAGTPKCDTISAVEIQRDYQLVVDEARGRFYPRRRSYQGR